MRRESAFASIPMVMIGAMLLTLAAPRLASADWPQCGRPISTASNSQQHSAIATDGTGGAIITWQDARFPRVNIFARRVLASGELDPAWPVDGQALLTDPTSLASADGGQFSPVIVSDGAGGAIVAWRDFRSPITGGDVFAQHVLSFGTVDRAWPANGTALCSIAGDQNTLAMVSDGAGGAIVAWLDNRPGASEVDVFAQHVLHSGQVDSRWPANGLAVCTAAGRQEFPVVVEDGSGGAIIAWGDPRSAATGLDVYAQHVLSSGVVDPAWPVNGRAVCVADNGQSRATITSDGAHGAVIAWSDGRVANTDHIFAMHVLGSGAVDPAWPANGRAISGAAVFEGRPLAVSDGRGGAVVNWQGFTVHVNMYVQHVLAAGIVDPGWPIGGRALSDRDRLQDFADIVPDGAGGAVIAWNDTVHVVAQHVLSSGVLDPTYPDTGRLLCNLADTQGDVALVATGGGGAIAAWTDTRNGKDTDIYAMQVLEAGTTDAPGPMTRGLGVLGASPNPALGSLTLRFSLPRGARVTMAIYDLMGRRVRELASGARASGDHAVAWDLRDDFGQPVGAGVYWARLEVDGNSLARKLVTLQ